ncbi:hypothetical protein B0H10DRAFT_1954546 [Mycena sp. CBHHK59/15]|nr:hypothetical protein B0H10DRAFT_1954546 [Mycena sp. CBHHK59/15]
MPPKSGRHDIRQVGYNRGSSSRSISAKGHNSCGVAHNIGENRPQQHTINCPGFRASGKPGSGQVSSWCLKLSSEASLRDFNKSLSPISGVRIRGYNPDLSWTLNIWYGPFLAPQLLPHAAISAGRPWTSAGDCTLLEADLFLKLTEQLSSELKWQTSLWNLDPQPRRQQMSIPG